MGKKEKLSAIRNELCNTLPSNGFVKNIGKVFFSLYGCSNGLQNIVYYASLRHEYDFEILSLDAQCFAGTKAHAEALMVAFGGRTYASEFCHAADNPKDIYIWEKTAQWDKIKYCYNPDPMKMEDAVEAIFG